MNFSFSQSYNKINLKSTEIKEMSTSKKTKIRKEIFPAPRHVVKWCKIGQDTHTHRNFRASAKKHSPSTCRNWSPEIKYVQLPNQCVHIILNRTFLEKVSLHSAIMITYKRLDNVVGPERSQFFWWCHTVKFWNIHNSHNIGSWNVRHKKTLKVYNSHNIGSWNMKQKYSQNLQ